MSTPHATSDATMPIQGAAVPETAVYTSDAEPELGAEDGCPEEEFYDAEPIPVPTEAEVYAMATMLARLYAWSCDSPVDPDIGIDQDFTDDLQIVTMNLTMFGPVGYVKYYEDVRHYERMYYEHGVAAWWEEKGLDLLPH